jgi:threonine dehydrogenase-like Zn-dependent dehydrogenase
LQKLDIEPIVSKNYLAKAPFKIIQDSGIISNIPPMHYLIELEACGLCHSDLLWVAYRSKDWEKIGHEFGGKILKCGESTSKFKEKQRVAIKNAAPCGLCDECIAGKVRYCKRVIVNKSGFDQYFLADERSIVDAEGLSESLLGLVEPLGVANDAVESADIRPGDRVTIYGLGAIGLMSGWLCIQKGASAVYGFARSSKCFNIAEEFGFAACFKSVEKEEMISNKILVFAPPSSLGKVISILQDEGLIVIAGLNEGNWNISESFNFEKLIFKRASIKGAFGYPNLFFESAVEQLRQDSNIFEQLISHEVGLSKLGSLVNKELQISGAVKIILKP